MTYSFLTGKEESDPSIAGLKIEGLKLMLLHRLSIMMPTTCGECETGPHYLLPGEYHNVECVRCKKGACPNCFDTIHSGWSYLCVECKNTIDAEQGFKSLTDEHFMKKSLTPSQEEKGDEDDDKKDADPDDNIDDLEDQDAFTEAALKAQGKNHKDNKKTTDTSEKICIYLKKSRCRHGLSGKKKTEDGEQCEYKHPKCCSRLLKFGFRGSKGCRDKNCQYFHPRICHESMDGNCQDIDCMKGYHVKFPFKKPNIIEDSDDKTDKRETYDMNSKKPNGTDTSSERDDNKKKMDEKDKSDKNDFLGQLMNSLQEMQRQNMLQQERLMKSILERLPQPPT